MNHTAEATEEVCAEEILSPLWTNVATDVPVEVIEELRSIILKHQHAFSLGEWDLGFINLIKQCNLYNYRNCCEATVEASTDSFATDNRLSGRANAAAGNCGTLEIGLVEQRSYGPQEGRNHAILH